MEIAHWQVGTTTSSQKYEATALPFATPEGQIYKKALWACIKGYLVKGTPQR